MCNFKLFGVIVLLAVSLQTHAQTAQTAQTARATPVVRDPVAASVTTGPIAARRRPPPSRPAELLALTTPLWPASSTRHSLPVAPRVVVLLPTGGGRTGQLMSGAWFIPGTRVVVATSDGSGDAIGAIGRDDPGGPGGGPPAVPAYAAELLGARPRLADE